MVSGSSEASFHFVYPNFEVLLREFFPFMLYCDLTLCVVYKKMTFLIQNIFSTVKIILPALEGVQHGNF